MKKLINASFAVILVIVLVLSSVPIAITSAQSSDDDFTYTVNNDNTVTITGYTGSSPSVTVPSVLNGYTVTTIGDMAFYSSRHLVQSIVLPNTVETIATRAFYDCPELEQVILPDSIKEIGFHAFHSCGKLRNVTLPNGLQTITMGLFEYCLSLESIVIPDSVTTIESYAFNTCRNLKSVIIPSEVTRIGYSAFQGCESLQSIHLPNITAIESDLFYNCRSLKEVVIPYGVTTIEYRAFYNCFSLETVSIPDTVTSIAYEAFCGCTNLPMITVPEGVTSIGNYAFSNCTLLQRIVFPNTLERLGESVFHNSYNLKYIYYRGTPAEWGAIQIPSASNPNLPFISRLYFNRMVKIDDVVYALCDDNTAVVVEYEGKETDLILPSVIDGHTVTAIGCLAFENQNNLYSVTLPQNLISVEFGAFFACTNLKQLDIPDTVTTIGDRAFGMCSGIQTVRFSENLTTIGEYAFYGCHGLQDIVLTKNVRTILYGAFAYCVNLKHVALHEGLSSIAGYAFSEGVNLQSVYYSGDETSWNDIRIEIGNETLLNTPRIYGAITSYNNLQYKGNVDCTITIVSIDTTADSVTIPKTINGIPVSSLASDIFENRPLLTTIKYHGNEEEWQALINEGVSLPEQVYVLFDANRYVGYPDVQANVWYYDAVEHTYVKGYMTGFKNGLFGPAAAMQRQDFILILARIANADLELYHGQNGGLKDVDANGYYAPAVAWAVDNNIVTGYQNGCFGVGDTITREQVCTILYRYMNSPDVENTSELIATFPDGERISDFAKNAAAWAVQAGIMKGMSSGDFSPITESSRAQVATIIMRMDREEMF